MTGRETHRELMARWTTEWGNLGRWQALNMRLATRTPTPASGWMRRGRLHGIEATRPAQARFGAGVDA